jgi:hypothetical protein
MQEFNTEWRVGRIFHLTGGLRATNWFSADVDFEPNTLDGKFLRLHSKTFGGTFAELESMGLSIIGVDFYTSTLEVEGRLPPQWRSHHSPTKGWPCDEAAIEWRQIAHAAFSKKQGRLWDNASRIAHQLRACQWRVREVSEAYKNLLVTREWNKFKVGNRFKNGFSSLAQLTMQSFLIDACILRDYLAEFAAYFIYLSDTGEPIKKLTTLGSLKKFILKRELRKDPLTLYLTGAGEDGGWLKELGDYRDLIMHSAPLAHGDSISFVVEEAFLLPDNRQLPLIVCPIPELPQEIFADRTSGKAFDEFHDRFDRFTKAGRGESPAKDGLSYVHSALGELCELSNMISRQSPVKPKPIIIRESEGGRIEME